MWERNEVDIDISQVISSRIRFDIGIQVLTKLLKRVRIQPSGWAINYSQVGHQLSGSQ